MIHAERYFRGYFCRVKTDSRGRGGGIDGRAGVCHFGSELVPKNLIFA